MNPCKDGTCVVKIDLGHLRGRERTTYLSNKVYYSFQGIPYATPPIGHLRFKDPEPIEHWHTVIDATMPGNVCIQRGKTRIHGDVKGSEDCLYLNIFTTQFPDHDVTLHPVVVYFHGGGFNYGSTDEDIYGADFLLEHDVVVVTINYRLGALGFLTLNNEDIPGNGGLKDQRLGLLWIREHIIHFGGDPNNVMIFGNSAGAASVQYHILAPSSAGLFHKAVMQSGCVLNPWAFDENPTARVHRFAEILHYNGTDDEGLGHFFRSQSVLDIIHYQEQTKTPEEMRQCISFPFAPTIELHKTKNSFLTEHPRTLLEENKFTHVPVIIGGVSKEGLIALTRSDFMIAFNGSDFDKYVPLDLHLDRDSPQFQNIVQKIKTFYFHDTLPNLQNLDDFIEICGDLEFNIGIQKSIDYFLKHSTAPVYVYKFTFDGRLNFNTQYVVNKWPTLKIPTGPSHTDELAYLFRLTQAGNITKYKKALTMIDEMSSMWTNFASTQNPSYSTELKWEPTTKNNVTYLKIDENITSVADSYMSNEKRNFWNTIYEIITLGTK